MGPLREAFYRSFADRYFPGPAVEGKVDEATAKAHAAEIAGSYISSRRAESSFLSVLNLLQPEKVVVNEDGTISIAGAEGPQRRTDASGARSRPTSGARWTARGASPPK